MEHLGIIYKAALEIIKTSSLCRKHIGIEKEEYLGVGYIALVAAKKNFNPKRKTKFSTYAYKIIKNHFLKYALKNSTILKVGDCYRYQAWRVINGKLKTRGKDNILELAVKAMSGSLCEIDKVDLYKEENKFDWSDIEFLNKNFNQLDNDTKEILIMKYGLFNQEKKTLKQISEILNVPFKVVRKIERKGIGFLRKKMIKVY